MRVKCILHYALRARDPQKMGAFYATLFDGKFSLHPVMTALGIIIVKIDQSGACFSGLLEFWPWDVVWDSEHAVFRRVADAEQPSATSYGHLAVNVAATTEQLVEELKRRGIRHRMEPRGPGFSIPTIDDPEGNMIELFPNVDDMPLPPEAMAPPQQAAAAIAEIKARYGAEAIALARQPSGCPLAL